MPDTENEPEGTGREAGDGAEYADANGGRRRRGMSLASWIAVAIAIAVAVGVGVSARSRDGGGEDRAGNDDPPIAGCTRDKRMDSYGKNGSAHTDTAKYTGPAARWDNPSYTVNPPSGGDHLSRSVPPGVFEGANVPLDGYLVHSLEHGYVIIWFRPTLPDAEKAALRKVQAEIPRDTLLVEREAMEHPVAATSWGQRLLCDVVDEDTLLDFIKDNRNKAPEKVPH